MALPSEPEQNSKPDEGEPAAQENVPLGRRSGQVLDAMPTLLRKDCEFISLEIPDSDESGQGSELAEGELAARGKLSGRRSGQVPDEVPTLLRKDCEVVSLKNIDPDEPEQGGEPAEGEPAAQNKLSGRSSDLVPDEVSTIRRSARRVVRSPIPDSNELGSNNAGSLNLGASSLPPVQAARRNPKRKATPEVFDVPEDLLDASLERWKENERDDWPSWTEVESDPVFFARILKLIGVKKAKLQEVYSADAETLAGLASPVYGLIFLYEHRTYDLPSGPVKPPSDMWFANQTTTNACGTVALFNIIMNADGLPLGDRLERFKNECKYLSPAIRGYLLSQSTWIRAAANSFSRRLDLLDAALLLQNQVDESKKRETKKIKIKGPNRMKQTRTRPSSAGPSYHFIAYIPFQQTVWQLDGLEEKPVFVGEYREGKHWTSAVCNILAAHMLEGQDGGTSYNLLALTADPFGDTEAEVDAIPGREKDHTPWIHEWVKKLADHGVLKELHDTVKEANKP